MLRKGLNNMSVKSFIADRDQSPLIFSDGNCKEIEINEEEMGMGQFNQARYFSGE